MDKKLLQDLNVSVAAIAFLHASLRGKIIAQNFLAQTGFPDLVQNDVDVTEKEFLRVEKWLDELWKGLPILSLSWRAPETFEGNKAFDLLGAVKQEYLTLTIACKRAIQSRDLQSRREELKFMISIILRAASAREDYVKCYLNYGHVFKQQEVADQFMPLLTEVAEDLKIAQGYADTMRKPGFQPDEAFVQEIQSRIISVSGILRMNVHDINILLGMYSSRFTYLMADISENEGNRWASMGVEPRIAGYWRAYDIGAEEAVAWMQAQIPYPGIAREWKGAGFAPGESIRWYKNNFTPLSARQWQDAGYAPEQAVDKIKRGITDPHRAIG